MYIEHVPNRTSPPAVLVRESYRANGKVKKRMLANLTGLPDDVIAAVLAGYQKLYGAAAVANGSVPAAGM